MHLGFGTGGLRDGMVVTFLLMDFGLACFTGLATNVDA